MKLHKGDHADHGNAAFFFQHPYARIQDRLVSTEFVDDQSLYHGSLIRLQKLSGTDQLGKHSAPVDISGQKDRRAGHLCHSHVHDVV